MLDQIDQLNTKLMKAVKSVKSGGYQRSGDKTKASRMRGLFVFRPKPNNGEGRTFDNSYLKELLFKG